MSIDTIREARDAAWMKCREEREPYEGSDDWTVGEAGTYRGFFNLGYDAALSTIDPDAKPQEPSKDIKELIETLFIQCFVPCHHFTEMPAIKFSRAINMILAHDKAIRRECADRACVACAKKTTGSECKGELKSRCSLRAAILGAEPAKDDGPAIGDLVVWIYCGDWHAGIMDESRLRIFPENGVNPIVVLRAAEVKRRIEKSKDK